VYHKLAMRLHSCLQCYLPRRPHLLVGLFKKENNQKVGLSSRGEPVVRKIGGGVTDRG
jgi:hypothetical protein